METIRQYHQAWQNKQTSLCSSVAPLLVCTHDGRVHKLPNFIRLSSGFVMAAAVVSVLWRDSAVQVMGTAEGINVD